MASFALTQQDIELNELFENIDSDISRMIPIYELLKPIMESPDAFITWEESPNRINNLKGLCYQYGIKGSINIEKAMELFNYGIEMSDKYSCLYFAVLIMNDMRNDRDLTNIITHLDMALSKGAFQAHYYYGLLYLKLKERDVEGVSDDFNKAIEQFQLGSTAGDSKCKSKLIDILEKNKTTHHEELRILYDEMIHAGDNTVYYKVGQLYENTDFGESKGAEEDEVSNYEIAFQYYLEGSKKNDYECQKKMLHEYIYGSRMKNETEGYRLGKRMEEMYSEDMEKKVEVYRCMVDLYQNGTTYIEDIDSILPMYGPVLDIYDSLIESGHEEFRRPMVQLLNRMKREEEKKEAFDERVRKAMYGVTKEEIWEAVEKVGRLDDLPFV